MAYRFIDEHQKEFGVRWLLKRMGIYPNAYYNYLKQTKAESHEKKESVLREIKDLYHKFGGILGHRSMQVFLARNSDISQQNHVPQVHERGIGPALHLPL